MTTNVTPFFALPENQRVLVQCANVLRTRGEQTPHEPDLLRLLGSFIDRLSSFGWQFDAGCQFNIESIGKQYMDAMQTIADGSKGNDWSALLMDVSVLSYCFLRELEFGSQGELDPVSRSFKDFVHKHWDQFSGIHKSQLVYASYEMPAQMLKKYLFSSELNSFKSFDDAAFKAEQKKEELDKAFTAYETRIKDLEAAVKQQETQLNFVSLVKGFENLKVVKETEKKGNFWAVVGLAIAMLVPLVLHFGFVLWNIKDIESHASTLLFSVPATLGLELILLYFFRVVLQNFRSIQTQLLQIDLRVSLCQFIQSYAEYSSKIKKDDASALERFEALIFSGLVGEGKDLPTTFDGLEQVAGLIKAVRDK